MDKSQVKRIFLAGVIQGSFKDKSIHSQEYRGRITSILKEAFPEAEIIDPFSGHENSIDYDDDRGKQTFLKHLDLATGCDLLVAYLPHASLGTAIEIWETHRRNIPIWTISPMKTNWIIRFCSSRIFEDIESFAAFLKDSHIRVLADE